MQSDETYKSTFDVEGKPRAWHTAFYYLAEHVRMLTNGSVNHKGLYALVGTEGRYLNHNNPTVRKRTAGALSRMVHSQAYAKDMCEQYEQSYSTFARAALEVCQVVRQVQRWDDVQLAAYLRERCWPDVRHGLWNEQQEWRDIDLDKVDIEMSMLVKALASDIVKPIDVRAATGSETNLLYSTELLQGVSEVLFATMLHVLAFSRLNAPFARGLADQYPTAVAEAETTNFLESQGACLVKFSDASRSALIGTWPLTMDRPFAIGRYTDCDIVETEKRISRVHCYVFFQDGVWYVRDNDSRNGIVVQREGSVIYDSLRDGSDVAVPLQQGDSLILANRCFYWFGALMG